MDKSDIYWCLTAEGLSSVLEDNVNAVSSGIEKQIASYLVDKAVKIADKNLCCSCINYINERKDKNVLETVLFDLLMAKYAWHMGNICYAKSHDPIQAFIGIAGFMSNSWENRYKDRYAQAFVNVHKKLNKYPYVILSNLLYSHKTISNEEFVKYVSKFIGNTHVHFEKLVAPKSHYYGGKCLLEVLLENEMVDINDYYRRKYNVGEIKSLRFKSDYSKVFYQEKHRLLFANVFGNLDIYN